MIPSDFPHGRRPTHLLREPIEKRSRDGGAPVAPQHRRILEFARTGVPIHGFTAGQVHAALKAHLGELEPGLSVGQALLKRGTDPGVRALRRLGRTALPDRESRSEPVAKSAAECEVDRLAAELREAEPALTMVQARARVWQENPELVLRYRASRS